MIDNMEEENWHIDIESIQDHNDPYWTRNLRGFLGMTDQIMRLCGDDEGIFKEQIANFMWKVVQANLNATTDARDENEMEHCGTFPKFKGETGISHLIADAYPRSSPSIDAFNSSRQHDEE
jgi:hypothetical protein|tara:strand:- start:123 stop:485 length:363 start_codon:yes stop_codon:yes gene_type:complete